MTTPTHPDPEWNRIVDDVATIRSPRDRDVAGDAITDAYSLGVARGVQRAEDAARRPSWPAYKPGDERITYTTDPSGARRRQTWRQVGWHGQTGAFYALDEDPSVTERGSFAPLWLLVDEDWEPDDSTAWQPGDPVYPQRTEIMYCPGCATRVTGPGAAPPMRCPECGTGMVERAPGLPCCDFHTRTCEPPSELCCAHCTEATHPEHRDGSACVLAAPQPERAEPHAAQAWDGGADHG